jgi:hypothetical protein
MEDDVLETARQNLAVWEHYLNGIADAGDEIDKSRPKGKLRVASSR